MISKTDLRTEVRASGGTAEQLTAIAAETKAACPVGKALGTVQITVEAVLL